MEVKIKPIGIIHSPYKSIEEIPREYESTIGEVIVFKEYEQGLQDIEGSSHLIILWIFHKSKGYSLVVKPLYHEGLHGVFATRHPNRPNPVGVTVVELLERKGNILKIKGIDAIDKTPVIDIKPYTSRDRKENIKTGWMPRF
ncbi:MAG: tRNA (N6-threonylcarbamoyladenosine(37)-N6)-methyltransferase TrmO [Candidatus Bathyarchaeia archaeon]